MHDEACSLQSFCDCDPQADDCQLLPADSSLGNAFGEVGLLCIDFDVAALESLLQQAYQLAAVYLACFQSKKNSIIIEVASAAISHFGG